MSLDTLPAELLINLPTYLHSLEDLCSLFSTSRALHRACANPDPKIIPQLAASSGRVFFRPHPHLLIAATARQVADWAVQHDDRRLLLEQAMQGGVDKLLELAVDVAELTMDDIRNLYAYKCNVINPLDRRLDFEAGPSSDDSPMTVCNDPETALLSWVIYGELFHHSLELAYLPFPLQKPLSSIIRYKWFVYCMPDVNSFDYMGFPRDGSETPQFFKEYVQHEADRFQQLSMNHATNEFFTHSLWNKNLLEDTPVFQAMNPALRETFTSSVMHMGLKSLEILLPGGLEKYQEDLDRIVDGIRGLIARRGDTDKGKEDATEIAESHIKARLEVEDQHLRQLAGDPWLWTAFPTLRSDLSFTLWGSWAGENDDEPLMAALRDPPQKNVPEEG
ncbi:hypothetical protein C8R47DRAFT_1064694 [Mycena vitilis]|nr:hypothetical protein C8R47DRAFT_1064694 [Mycena vitilis]